MDQFDDGYATAPGAAPGIRHGRNGSAAVDASSELMDDQPIMRKRWTTKIKVGFAVVDGKEKMVGMDRKGLWRFLHEWDRVAKSGGPGGA